MTAGLEGIVAAETTMSQVNGDEGQLIIRGYELESLAFSMTFEDVAQLLWADFDPVPTSADFATARQEAFRLVPRVLAAGSGQSISSALRTGLSMIREGEGSAVRVAAAVPVFIAALYRAGQGAAPIAPKDGHSHAQDFLWMLDGKPVDKARIKAMDSYLATIADHGMNASTFTARVVASTRAGVVASVVAALGALSGPLHGGAPGPVLDMLDAVKEAGDMTGWVENELAEGRRIMGFGHRIYRTRDPRADVLKQALAILKRDTVGGIQSDRLAFAEKLEQVVIETLHNKYPTRKLDTNVEFFTALLLEAVGLPRSLFTPTFGVGRVLGWVGHIHEQETSGRILRPASLYTGPVPDGVTVLRTAAG